MTVRFAPAARFLLGAYLNGTAIWFSLLALGAGMGGDAAGPAFAIAAALATGALKAWLLEPAAEFLGMERRPRRRFGAAKEFAFSAAAYAAVVAAANASGVNVAAEPVSLGLAVEAAYSIVKFLFGAAARAATKARALVASRAAPRSAPPSARSSVGQGG